jgi:hypothetical protein
MDEAGGQQVEWLKPDIERQVLHAITYIWNLKQSNSYRQKVESWLPGSRCRGGMGERLGKGY